MLLAPSGELTPNKPSLRERQHPQLRRMARRKLGTRHPLTA